MLAVWSAEIYGDARPGNGNTPLTAALPVAGWQRRLEAGLRSPHTPVLDWSDSYITANVAGSFGQKFMKYFWYYSETNVT